MIVNDPIADMLTRIRNAQVAGHENVSIPASNMKKSIAKILLNEGFVKNVEYLNEGVQGSIRITLKYVEKRPVIVGLKRISRPGLRVYAQVRRDPQGSRRPGHRHCFHAQGRDDRQRSPQKRRWRRSAGLCVVNRAQMPLRTAGNPVR